MALILVTGASTGLGRLTAASLIQRGHDVVVHMRNEGSIAGATGLERAHTVLLGDLGRPDHALAIAEEANTIGAFDAVIHNAGVFSGPDLFAVNVVAPYILTAAMRPAKRSIFVSSSMHMAGSIDLSAVDFDIARTGSYEDSKLYVTTLAMLLAQRRPATMSHAVDPGWVPTRMGGPAATGSLESGHRTQEWLATTHEDFVTPRTGGYWHHERASTPSRAAHDLRFQGRLAKKLAIHTGIPLPRASVRRLSSVSGS